MSYLPFYLKHFPKHLYIFLIAFCTYLTINFLFLFPHDLFYNLITVSGIGPKVAITILSGLSISDLIVAISNQDIRLLSKIKGLGKKTAERLCLELKDKLNITSLLQIDPVTYTPEECPLCKLGIELTKPGSRVGK